MILALVFALVTGETYADLAITNAVIPTSPQNDSIAMSKGRVIALYSAKSGQTFTAARTINADGRVVLPGFIDSHIHFAKGGLGQTRVRVDGLATPQAMVERIVAFANEHKDLGWIVGRGFSYDAFAPGYPTRQLLDVIERPVVILSYDGHTAWANSKALAGITKDTPDPKGGRIIREKDGTPAGALLEDAMDLIETPQPTVGERKAGILAAQRHALAAGLTAINDFADDDETLDAYLALEKEGLLQIRVFFSRPLAADLSGAKAQRTALAKASSRVRFGTLKGFLDGVVESNTAAFIEPYADNPKVRGEMHLSQAELGALVSNADNEGFSVSLHAIGDLSVRSALDAFSRAAQRNGTTGLRHRIEHIETLDPADVAKFQASEVAASMQPYHAEPADVPGKGVWENKVGKKRLPHIFPWNEIRAAGGVVAFGSDWPVMSLDPLMGLAVATTRRNGHGLPKEGWVPAQKLSLTEALKAYTENAAWALHAEKELGTLAVGRAADVVILSRKVDVTEPLSFYWGSVDITIIDGKIAHER